MNKKLDAVRTEIMEAIKVKMTESGYDVLITGTQELTLPIVSADGEEEGYLNLIFKLPIGSHDGEAYDGYEVAEDFARKQKEKALKAAEAKAKKEAKAAKDAELRRQKAEAKVKREAEEAK